MQIKRQLTVVDIWQQKTRIKPTSLRKQDHYFRQWSPITSVVTKFQKAKAIGINEIKNNFNKIAETT